MIIHIWKTREGETMPVTEMTDSHLFNSINVILRAKEKTNNTVKWLVILMVEAQRRGLAQPPQSQGIITTVSDKWVKSDARRLETYNIYKAHNIVCECGSSQLYPIWLDYWRSDDGNTYDLDLICGLCSKISTFSREYFGYAAYETWRGEIIRNDKSEGTE